MCFILKLENELENNVSKEKNKLVLIDAPLYGYWSALWRSFYSRRLYVDVGKRWKGTGLLYLLFIIAILSIPFFFKMTITLRQSFNSQIIEPLENIPVFYVQNGQVIFDKPMPYLVKNSKDQIVAIIDTTGKINSFTNEYPDLGILVNKDRISFLIPNPPLFNLNNQSPPSMNKPIVQPFDKEINFVFNGKQFVEQNSVIGLKYGAQLMVYPIILSLLFSIFTVFFLVLALLGQTFSTVFFSFKLSFLASSRLLIVAGSPMLLFLLIMLTFDKIFSGSGFVLFFLLITYYSYALFALRSESRNLVAS